MLKRQMCALAFDNKCQALSAASHFYRAECSYMLRLRRAVGRRCRDDDALARR